MKMRICEIGGRLSRGRMAAAMMAVLAIVAAMGAAQVSKEAAPVAAHGASIEGVVQDSNGKPLANAEVYLEPANANDAGDLETRTATTSTDGSYRISAILPGSYMVRAQHEGYRSAFVGPLTLAEKQIQRIDLTLTAGGAGVSGGIGNDVPQLFDAPQFTVAGVTNASGSGGHGSDVLLRRGEAEVMTKETVALGPGAMKDGPETAKIGSSNAAEQANAEKALRERLQREPDDAEVNCALGKLLIDAGRPKEAIAYLERALQISSEDADKHRLLADAEEKSGDPLDAVHQYQQAAEMDASEENLFAWGAELLAHRALEPATEVLSKATRLFPRSERMQIALGVAWYERGSFDEAARWMEKASDLEPGNVVPYLFLGRMEVLAGSTLAGAEERFARFVRIEPGNARANYYYAVSLWKGIEETNGAAGGSETVRRVEDLLKKAVDLDSSFAPGFLQLGIFYWDRKDTAHAVEEYRKAIEAGAGKSASSSLESDEAIAEAHYRLAQAYWRNGDKEKAETELKLQVLAKQAIESAEERQRKEVQEFVMTLKQSELPK